ncbi:tetratricopeptide repeat protein [Phormidium sp. CLA17]|uniref:tetratricopeptide repeat protein n=1 Tax=Leptolyngbya sp. Cla-17 TaxID=2803751 RepID=UPI0014917D1A|nr:tetratricopeptide repeat protein [Leptolyngbya sp. Cla-17]MBM0742088.1 tetratricopeptide repeat protein [Leptolyngbya sp. Cla-17]
MRPFLNFSGVLVISWLFSGMAISGATETFPAAEGAQAQAQPAQPRSIVASQLYDQGRQQYQLKQFAAALESTQTALVIYRELNDRPSMAQVLNFLGNVLIQQKDSVKAIAAYQQSLQIAREIRDRRSEGNTLNNLGAIYYRQGDYAKAIEVMEQDLVIARELKNRQSQRQALTNLGLAYRASGYPAKAVAYELQSVAVARELNELPLVIAPMQAGLEFAGSQTRNVGTVAEGFRAWFVSPSLPPAPDLRVIIRNITAGMNQKPFPYTNRTYDKGWISEELILGFGTKHDGDAFVLTDGKNDFTYEIKQGDRVLESGSFNAIITRRAPPALPEMPTPGNPPSLGGEGQRDQPGLFR